MMTMMPTMIPRDKWRRPSLLMLRHQHPWPVQLWGQLHKKRGDSIVTRFLVMQMAAIICRHSSPSDMPTWHCQVKALLFNLWWGLAFNRTILLLCKTSVLRSIKFTECSLLSNRYSKNFILSSHGSVLHSVLTNRCSWSCVTFQSQFSNQVVSLMFCTCTWTAFTKQGSSSYLGRLT